ncbi:MAG: hypothetical protein NT051_04295 [Candidatus Micrarchaeota archaeon]|nr:hypothetical protein [Candidatus Micrarchaeota archaeon]
MAKFIAFPKPEASKNRAPLKSEFDPKVWEKYKQANERIGVNAEDVSAMQFVMRTLGSSNGFEVLGIKKAAMDASVYVAHYNHTFSYNGGFSREDASGFALNDLVYPYTESRWFFALDGDHALAERIRGPTNGAAARDPQNAKFAPYTIRGIYGKDSAHPVFHMTAETPCNGKDIDAETVGKLEIVRFFGAGSMDAKLENWPLAKGSDGLYLVPKFMVDLESIIVDDGKLRKSNKPAADAIIRMIEDFPEITHGDISAFFGKKSDEFFRFLGIRRPEPAKLVLLE